ncbi:6-oxocyclohex-1-ene-1-carbonyl-CoA hydratase [Thauera chlorobenzoica]|uniref:6-oxocyclohex-1-ene-1-carbonyl-CoA hydratase n=2 Tax=Thauera chlorobenzoica TaxID=96773 RepID=A0A1H5YTU4_9RHOO|nr:6-oxocyclohex-1-ene-1-carbonyl-CoA hydratase [Thauera chlorobenzoica]APR06217.1 oxoacyl-CoA hydrolase MbdY [Thauera chlorobenzoica]SEG27132.1 6-oxo-cyclohex-1-ene-carbonyl-CoA hydrolase [Thauera chlorobenzoica]
MRSVTDQIVARHTAPRQLTDHCVAPDVVVPGVVHEKRPARTPRGDLAPGIYHAWITIDNQAQFNSYSVDMLKGIQWALKTASNARDVVSVVLTGAGSKAFCTGGNATDFARYYARNPQEFRQFMRLFNDTVSAVMVCEKPVICRVNGMRTGGAQELGLACDFTIAQDLALFGLAGPKHGGAMIGGATDFLPVMIGAEAALAVGTLCESLSAHKARRLGMITAVVPALKVDGKFVPNPLVVTDRCVDEFGELVLGEPKTGEALLQGKALLARGEVDLSLLDAKVEELCAKFVTMFPDSLTKSLEALRKPKIEAWNRNKEDNRAWLALNMMTEACAGFRAFAEGSKEAGREIDFVALRQALAKGAPWTPDLIDNLMPHARN